MGTIFERLVPCMSGSSKRTLRMPRFFHSARTCSMETDFSSAITMASTPRSVIPRAYVEADLSRDRQHAAFAPIAARQRGGEHPRRLHVAAVPAQRRIRVVNDDQRALRAANQHLEINEVTLLPI